MWIAIEFFLFALPMGLFVIGAAILHLRSRPAPKPPVENPFCPNLRPTPDQRGAFPCRRRGVPALVFLNPRIVEARR